MLSLYIPILVLGGLAAVFAIFSLVMGSLACRSAGIAPSLKRMNAGSTRRRQWLAAGSR